MKKMQETEQEPFDPIAVLSKYAARLDAISQPSDSAHVGYDIMSGALFWSDETDRETPIEVVWALRFLRAYRTSLMLNETREEFKPLWELSLSLFPKWVGFRPERREPTPELLEIFRRGDVPPRKCLRNMQRQIDSKSNQENS